MDLARSTYYYRPKGRCKDDGALSARTERSARSFPATAIGVSPRSFATKAGVSITSESPASCASGA